METEEDLLQMIHDSLEAGGRGVAIGRNVFQSEDPVVTVSKISRIVHGGESVEEVLNR
jgi:fructose-bisphosphate aldolase/2-amino-3,7-dideoxy-D-threo-hept-6-ulosonate synthase